MRKAMCTPFGAAITFTFLVVPVLLLIVRVVYGLHLPWIIASLAILLFVFGVTRDAIMQPYLRTYFKLVRGK